MSEKVKSLLDQLQATLEKASQWQTIAPEPEKLMSTEPFSIDTLTFLEWLQWIYVARLRAIMDAGGQLPQGAQVYPYAEEALKAAGIQIPGLLELVLQLDTALK